MLDYAHIEKHSISKTKEGDLSLLDVLIAIVRRMRLIVTIAVLVTLTGVVTALLLPFKYTAWTSILPPQQSSSAGAALMAQLGSFGSMASLAGGSLGLKNPNDLQVAMLKSQTVEDAMLDRFHLIQLYHAQNRSMARAMFEKTVDVNDAAKDGLIRIFVTDRDPRRAMEMANGYVEEFKKFSATLAVTEASQRRLFFQQQLDQAKVNVAKAEEDLKNTEQKTGLIQLDAQARAAIELVSDLRAQIAAKEVQISSMRSFETGENPDLQIAEQQLAGLRAQEDKIGATSEGVSNALIPKGPMQEAGIEYVGKLREVKYYETIFDLLAKQYEIAKVDEARQGALIQVVDPAILPDHRSSPRRTLIFLGSMVLGIFLGVVYALAAESLAGIEKDPAERARLDTLKALMKPAKRRAVSP